MYSRCNCKDSTARQLSHIKNELNIVFNEESRSTNIGTCLIDGRTFQDNLVILEVERLFKICRKQWRQVEEIVFTTGCYRNVDVFDVRKQIVDVLSYCRYSIKMCMNPKVKEILKGDLMKHVKLLKSCVGSWSDLDEGELLKVASPSIKDDLLPICQYFHMYIDVKWLLLTLSYVCEGLLVGYEELLKDLVVFSYAFYKKQDLKDAVQINPFVCSCLTRLWLLLQIINEKYISVGSNRKNFWEIFNEVLNKNTDDDAFSIWLLHFVATLEGYNQDGEFQGLCSARIQENDVFMDQKLKCLNNKLVVVEGNNQKLLNCCKLIHELLEQWWIQNSKSEPYQILWEIFNKHINLNFGSNKINSSSEFVQKVDQIISHSNTDNSYEYFLHMLNKYLLKYPNQWSKIRGRIYSKLPPNKINELTEIGLYNIALLFLTLIRSVSIAEISEKLLWLLSTLKNERRNSRIVINIYMSLIILHVRQGYSIKEVSAQLVDLVQQFSKNREMFYLIRPYVDGFDAVLNASQNYNLHQHFLLGSWICKYLISCQSSDLCYFLNVLVTSAKRIRNAGAWNEWESTLKEYVLPGLKTIAMKENAPLQVGELAAVIEPNPTSEWVITFVADPIAPNVVCHFISTLLEDVAENIKMPEHHETAILHAWIRCCLLNCDDRERLTNNVMKIRSLSNLNIKMENNRNPIISFIIALGNADSKVANLRELCEQCFGRLDPWIVNPYLKSPQSDVLVLHIYTCMALLFYHCSSLLYQKNRSNCLLNRLITVFLLSNDILMGKSPHPHVLSAIQRTWHRFVQGIFSLDCTNDAYLERILRDMVVHYVPLLSSTSCPILKCMDNQNLATLILEKLSNAFLCRTARTTNGNTTKALRIITSAVENSTSTENIKLILGCTLTSILEVIMFHVHKNTAIDFVKFISSNENYSEFKDCMNCSIITVTERHLAFHTNNYFQFVNVLAKIIPRDLQAVLHSIKKQIVEVERMRGVGYDKTLRQGLDKLEKLLS